MTTQTTEPPTIHEFRSAEISVDDTTCKDARSKYINNEWQTIEESIQLEFFLKKCNLKTHNQKNPTDQRKGIAHVSVENGEQKILFGIISLKDGQTAAAYAKLFLSVITGDAFLNDPVTSVLSETVGKYSIDSWLEAAKEDDPLLFLFPMALPGKQFVSDVFDEINKQVDLTSITTSYYDLSGESDPENVLFPFAETQIKVIEGGLQFANKILSDAGDVIRNNEDILFPFSPVSINQIDTVIKDPSKIPEVVAEAAAKPVQEIVDGVNKAIDIIKDNPIITCVGGGAVPPIPVLPLPEIHISWPRW